MANNLSFWHYVTFFQKHINNNIKKIKWNSNVQGVDSKWLKFILVMKLPHGVFITIVAIFLPLPTPVLGHIIKIV